MFPEILLCFCLHCSQNLEQFLLRAPRNLWEIRSATFPSIFLEQYRGLAEQAMRFLMSEGKSGLLVKVPGESHMEIVCTRGFM